MTAGPATNAVVSGPAPLPAPTWYDRIGPERVDKLLIEFCIRVIVDDQLAGYVLRLDLRVAIRNHCHYLLLILLGGPQPYDRTDYLWQQWRRRYAPLGMTVADFDRLVWHLGGALREVGVDAETSRYLLGRVIAGRWIVAGR